MKKLFLLGWYFIGCIVSIPAILFIIASRWMGIKAEEKALLRELNEKDVNKPV